MALLIQARHLFYGLSLLGKYAGTGWKKPLLIFGLCDETFSITCSADVPPEVDRGWFYLWVTVLDWCYWVAGAAVLLLSGVGRCSCPLPAARLCICCWCR